MANDVTRLNNVVPRTALLYVYECAMLARVATFPRLSTDMSVPSLHGSPGARRPVHTHTHTHTHVYIYIYIYIHRGNGGDCITRS